MKPIEMTEEEIINALKVMQNDPAMATVASYNPNKELWPDNSMPFVERHLTYLRTHKHVKPKGYLSNLRLMLKYRG